MRGPTTGHTIRFEDDQWQLFTYWVERERQEKKLIDPGGPAEQIRRWVRCWIDTREKEGRT